MQEQPLLQFHSTVLRVSNLEASLDWYQRVFDFDVLFVDPHYRLRVLSDRQDRMITLWEADGGAPVPTQRNGSYLVFVTPDIERARAELERRGCAPEPTGIHPGLRISWLPDPDGHRHAIMQFMPE